MRFLRFFTREEPVAGLEISEGSLRLVSLETDYKTGEIKVSAFEEAVPKGAVVSGKVANKDALVSALKKLSAKTGKELEYFVVSVPAGQIYYKMFPFPKTVSGEKLEEAMKLTVGFQLPFKLEEIYLDWERPEAGKETEEVNEISLSAVKKTVIDDYLSAFSKAGINAVAVEFHPLSLMRSVSADKEAYLAFQKSGADTVLFIFKNKLLRFLRVLPKEYISDEALPAEIKKFENFYATKNGGLKKTIPSGELKTDPKFLKSPEIKKNESLWLIALGAAIRATLPRKEDKLISLMPLGTEKAYEYQRAASFSTFITNLSIGLSVFFAGSFLASLGLMVTIQENFSKQLSGLASLPVSEEFVDLEARAKKFNTLAEKTGPIVASLPRWSFFTEGFLNILPKDIVISNISAPGPEGRIGISGVAQNRPALNNFRKILQGWGMISSVDLPATNLEQKENIPFQASFALSDPGTLYNWK